MGDPNNTDSLNKGLTQDDFRKLINSEKRKNISTPALGGGRYDRNHSRSGFKDDSSKNNPYLSGFKSDNKGGKAYGNKGTMRPPPQVAKKWKKENGETYRDRAAERRKGENQDYLDTEQILSNLNQTSEEVDKRVAYQQSKYLGGDLEHTHLVKGLDYALLAKVKSSQAQESKGDEGEMISDEDIEQIYQQKQKELEDKNDATKTQEAPPTFLTGLGERIFHQIMNNKKDLSEHRNPLFFPGKMAYNFELIQDKHHYSNPFFIPTTFIRSSIEIEDINEFEQDDLVSKNAVQKVITFFGQKRAGIKVPEEDPFLKAKAQSQSNIVEKIKIKEQITEDSSDDNIFSDVNSNYELNLEEEAKKRGENLDDLDLEIEEDKETTKKEEDIPEVSNEDKENISQNGESGSDDIMKKEIEKEHIRLRELFEVTSAKNRGPLLAARRTTEQEMHFGGDDTGSEIDEEEDEQVMDLGTTKNKRKQMSRNDFGTEEEFQKYKENQLFMPKAAFTFGVKSRDRKYKKSKSKNEGNSKLDREYESLEKYMKNQGYNKSSKK